MDVVENKKFWIDMTMGWLKSVGATKIRFSWREFCKIRFLWYGHNLQVGVDRHGVHTMSTAGIDITNPAFDPDEFFEPLRCSLRGYELKPKRKG